MLKANKSLLLNILPILDTLMFACKHSQGKDQNLNLSVQQFLDILKQEGDSNLSINYDIGLSGENHIFLNGSLTGRGGRLYNSELVSLDKDLVFEMVDSN